MPKRKWLVHYTVTGHGTSVVEADDEEGARQALWDGLAPRDDLTEWEYDEIEGVEPADEVESA